MNARELLEEFAGAGIRLWREDQQLRFRAPRGAMTDHRLAALRSCKAELLATMADTAAEGPGAVWQADPEAAAEPFPLTDIQSAYLFGRNSAFDYGGVSCHLYEELEYPADLDPARLQQAWDGLVRRHGTLRTVIRPDGTQRVLPELPDTRIEFTDLRTASGDAVDEAISGVRDAMSHQVHPAGERPMYELRLTLLPERSVLHVSVDFMALDWLSMQRVLSELDRRYQQPDCDLPEVDATFRDYVLAERRLRDTEQYARDREYWWQRIDELPGAPALPLRDDHDPATAPPRFRRLTTTVHDRVWQALKARAAERGITPANAVLSAYAETIARWSGTERFCLGLPVLNRMPLHPHVDRLLGDFTSLSVLAVDFEQRANFVERARALGERVFDDLDHRLFSGVEVLREVSRRRGREAAAMLPVVFTGSIGVGGTEVSAAGRKTRPAYGISQTPQVWIDCQVGDQFGGLDMNWDVREGIFPDGMVDDMFAAFVDLLHQLAEHDEPWEDAAPQPLPAEQRDRRAAVNATEAPEPDCLLHEPLVAYAREHPDRVAVVDAAGTLTYGQWLGRAAGVAERLREAGCRPGDFVGVLIDKCRDQAVGVLGVLLAGGVYVPVDLGQPAARRDRILTGSGARFAVVTDAGTGAPPGIRAVEVAGVPPVPVAEIPAGRQVDPGELAYVMHTSGSTGVPKGVMISHHAAANTVHDINQRFGVNDSDRVLGLAALSFDLSVYDLFGPPALGATLVLPDPTRRGDPSHWAEMVAEHGVTLWNSVPAQLQMLMHYLDTEPTELADLRLALLSGDWIPLSLPDHAGRHVPAAELVSLGGATEASIWSNYHRIETVEPHWRSIPYGVPLANQRFHVLDSALRDRPDLVVGELYIAGTGLATGYLNDPERTGERFIRHPATGERLYRTGDLGRYLPTGEIEFLGRADQQIKIRGHRVELGEIESVLGDHPAVGTCVVLAAGGAAFEQALIAFVIPAQHSGEVTAGELIGWVADRLPGHMVPARVRIVDALPLTPNGKVDRKRLLESTSVPSAPPPERAEPPRPGVEQRIAELWAEVLGGRLPSRDQGFFDAGGNSLLAAQFVGQVRERIPEAAPVTFDVLLRALLDTQTVAGLGKWLESEATPAPESLAGPTSALVQLGGSGQGPVRLLVHGGTGTLAEQQALIGELAAGPPLFGLVLPAPDSAAPVGLEELAAGYAREVLAAGFDEVEIIGYCLGGPIALELARALSEANAVVRGLTIVSGHRIPHLLQDELVVDYAFARTMGADPAALGWPADEAAVGRAVAAALTGSPDALAPGAIAALAGELEPVARRFRELGQQDTAERRAELHRALADSAPGKGGSARIALMHKAFTRFIEAAAHYRPEPYAGDVTFLRPVEPAHLVPGPQEDTALFWREVCLGDVTVVDIPGDHFSCLHPQHAPRVAEAIATSALERR
ncbi:pyochelin synthetase [Saccharopolyspora kobensis]|uniref:Phenyloxazoline synthase MbtB n=2 Tax=Saccharopolyspora kobensis TaxID=146035 RepID=A0A1H6A537_9PSEU|nr:non-ribosomal peptide synthetase [Saccharopolyspora kobensis]SEG43482.1 pyochelin synthetase [Saccharopolyspora kobensis]SFE19540.1 pyochelin synthetase [Saccharopolyspora kobensis]